VLRVLGSVAVSGLLGVILVGCQKTDEVEGPCDGGTYVARGKTLAGDVDGDGQDDRVTLRVDESRPPRCRHVLVVEGRTDTVARIKPLAWPGTNPRLLLLAEIDGHEGLEAVVSMSPANVYRPGAVYTMRDGGLLRMRRDVEAKLPDDLFPFADEFPAGVDCATEPGTIRVTVGNLAEQGTDDRYFDVTRSLYEARGVRFALVRGRVFRVDVGSEAERRWPEVRGDPFLNCPDRVD
jgi:hypothetical protein